MKKAMVLFFVMLAPSFVFAGDLQIWGRDIVIHGLNLDGNTAYDFRFHDFGTGAASKVLQFYGIVNIVIAEDIFTSSPTTATTIYGVNIDFNDIPAIEKIFVWDNILDVTAGAYYAPNFDDHTQDRYGLNCDLVQLKFTTAQPVTVTGQ